MLDLDEIGIATYPLIRQEMGDLLADSDESVQDRTCLACPEWSVRDVLAHTVHAFGAYMSDTEPEETWTAITEQDDDRRRDAAARRDRWTQAGVDERANRTVNQILEEWDEIIASDPARIWMGVLDGATHLYDIKETLGDASGRDSAIVMHAFERSFALIQPVKWDLEDVRFAACCTDLDSRFGPDGAPMVRGTTYELLRAGWGRRSLSRSSETLDWGDVPDSQRAAWSVYGWTD